MRRGAIGQSLLLNRKQQRTQQSGSTGMTQRHSVNGLRKKNAAEDGCNLIKNIGFLLMRSGVPRLALVTRLAELQRRRIVRSRTSILGVRNGRHQRVQETMLPHYLSMITCTPRRWEVLAPINTGCTIWVGTCGNGARTGMTKTKLIECYGVSRGMTIAKAPDT